MSLCRNLIFAICAVVLASGSAGAHTLFKKSLEKAYPTMKVSCNACHVKDESKKVRNEFGELFYKELKEEKITENWKAAKDESSEAKKAYENDVMVPMFEKALKKIQKEKVPEVEGEENPNAGKTYDELIKAEKIEKIKIDPKKVEALKAAEGSGAKSEGGSDSKDGSGSK